MRLLLLLASVTFATAASAKPRRADVVTEPPALLITGRQAGFLDELARAEDTLTAYAEHAQHLGSAYRSWLWVTPVIGKEMYGLTLRLDVR